MASKAQGRQTRERLIEAATRSFIECGFRGTSLNSIADAAGVTRQGLLHYFPSKADLLIAVLDDAEREMREHGWESDTVDVGFAGGLVAIMKRNLRDPGLSTLYTISAAESIHPDSPLQDFMRRREQRVHGEMAAAVKMEQAAGRLTRELDADTLAVALLATFNGLVLHGLLQPDVDVTAPLAAILRAVSA